MEFALPDEYPATAQPVVTATLPEGPMADCLSLAMLSRRHGVDIRHFPALPWVLLGATVGASEEDLVSVVEAALADTVGNVALFSVAEAAAAALNFMLPMSTRKQLQQRQHK